MQSAVACAEASCPTTRLPCPTAVRAQAAATALDRISVALGGRSVWPTFARALGELMHSADWRARRAGLLGLSLIGEGCRKVLAPQIKDVIKGVLPSVADPHPRVRHAALRCLGQLIVDFSDPHEGGDEAAIGEATAGKGTGGGGSGAGSRAKSSRAVVKSIQEAVGEPLLRTLIGAAANAALAPRTRGLACAALISYVGGDSVDADMLRPQLRPLLEALFSVVTGVTKPQPREAAMTAIGCVAQAAGDDFGAFYPIFCPIAKGIIQSATGKEESMLR